MYFIAIISAVFVSSSNVDSHIESDFLFSDRKIKSCQKQKCDFLTVCVAQEQWTHLLVYLFGVWKSLHLKIV